MLMPVVFMLVVVFAMSSLLRGSSNSDTDNSNQVELIEQLELSAVDSVRVTQAQQVPTGRVVYTLNNGAEYAFQTPDVNEIVAMLNEHGFDHYTVSAVQSSTALDIHAFNRADGGDPFYAGNAADPGECSARRQQSFDGFRQEPGYDGYQQ